MTLWVGNNVINPTDDNNNKSDELLLPFAPNYANDDIRVYLPAF